MKLLLTGLVVAALVLASSLGYAATAPATAAPATTAPASVQPAVPNAGATAQAILSAGWYFIPGGWYLLVPATQAPSTSAIPAGPKSATAGAVALPAGIPAPVAVAPTIRIRARAPQAEYGQGFDTTAGGPATGNNSGAGSLDSLR